MIEDAVLDISNGIEKLQESCFGLPIKESHLFRAGEDKMDDLIFVSRWIDKTSGYIAKLGAFVEQEEKRIVEQEKKRIVESRRINVEEDAIYNVLACKISEFEKLIDASRTQKEAELYEREKKTFEAQLEKRRAQIDSLNGEKQIILNGVADVVRIYTELCAFIASKESLLDMGVYRSILSGYCAYVLEADLKKLLERAGEGIPADFGSIINRLAEMKSEIDRRQILTRDIFEKETMVDIDTEVKTNK